MQTSSSSQSLFARKRRRHDTFPLLKRLKFKNVFQVTYPWDKHKEIFEDTVTAYETFETRREEYISRTQLIVSQEIKCLIQKESVRSLSCLTPKSILVCQQG